MNYSFLEEHKIIPVVVLKSVEEGAAKLAALKEGGINIAEITFRTECAVEALAYAVKNFPDMLIGAGTVINAEQCERALDIGAKFVVSPGFSKDVADICIARNIPYIPGVVTPTDIITALACGLNVLKFFPAAAYGGVKTLKAMSAAFPDVKFIPTGGIDDKNMAEYLSAPFVAAIGGSWMMKGDAEEVKRLSAEAVSLAKEIK